MLEVSGSQVGVKHGLYMEYRLKNKHIFQNPVVSRFFESREHQVLLENYLVNPTNENRLQLEHEFRRFLFRIRFVRYLCSLIRYSAIDFHRQLKREEERNQLVFDVVLDEEGDMTFGEFLYNRIPQSHYDIPTRDPERFHSSFVDENLYNAFDQLTDKQRLVVTLAYSACALDTEIARLLQISQQAITKTRLVALRKMRHYLLATGTPTSRGRKRGVS